MNNGNESAHSRRSLRHTRVMDTAVDRPVADLGPVRAGGRRDRRRQSNAPSTEVLAQDQAAPGEGPGHDTSFVVDPQILAQQQALAKRAAALNTRASKVQLSRPAGPVMQANGRPAPGENDPTAAHNLSIFSPGKFIRVLWAPRAEALAKTSASGEQATEAADPIGARTAHGLEPLDAMTAGLARVRRLRIMQYSIVSLGALALIAGIIMILGVFN